MNSVEVRQKFLTFFENRGHTRVSSSSLIPAEDPTLLFVNAGMNQFKDVFLGLDTRDYSRGVSAQKCVRAGGKHNDLDNVGHTSRHLTFFEMLGNFSFGDYFKKEAVEFAWELLTQEFALPPEKLWVTVFREDDEAANLWNDHVGVASERIVRMDEKDNFWQMGETGPCGPCSELYYDFGAGGSERNHTDCEFPCECGRYVEIWNLVFMQFDRNQSGDLNPLPRPSIDTGMGLERMASVLQDKISVFDTDLLRSLIDRGGELFGVRYGESPSNDVSLRIIADHVRSATFLISDGIIPSNEGRGYVLRKIMRRGIRQGTILGHKEPFLHTMTGHVVELMQDAYPDLVNSREYVSRVVESEERRFSATVSVAVGKLEEIAEKTLAAGSDVIAGQEVFRLYDTFGLPLDFIREISEEKALGLDADGFNAALEKQKKRAKESWKGSQRTSAAYEKFLTEGGTTFFGYDTTEGRARVLGIVRGNESIQTVEGKGGEAEVILSETPFYAESGGQVGDIGGLTSPNGAVRVVDTISPAHGLTVHRVEVEVGKLSVGEEVEARVDAPRRKRIAANHTGTHLLHAALRSALGVHVKQAGSLVAPNRLRFDYTHYAALGRAEIEDIEGNINRVILENHPVGTEIMELNAAVESGAIAFFGEKYQQKVRVVSVPGVSSELCGGTHTTRTGDIGLFKIVSEGSIASGIRRLEAVTGQGSYERLGEDEQLLDALTERLKTPRSELARTIEKILDQQKQTETELAGLKRKGANSRLDDLLQAENTVSGVRVVSQKVDGVDAALMRELAENLRRKMGSGIVVLGMASDGKATLVTSVSEDLQAQLHAGTIIKQVAALVGGSGGGRADFAQAGGKEPGKLDQALQEVYNIVGDLVG